MTFLQVWITRIQKEIQPNSTQWVKLQPIFCLRALISFEGRGLGSFNLIYEVNCKDWSQHLILW